MRRRYGNILVAVFVVIPAFSLPAVAGKPPCSPPVAQVSPASTVAPETTNGSPTVIRLNGNSSKGTVDTYLWTQLSDGNALPLELTDPSAPQVGFPAPDVGPAGATFRLRLTVSGCGTSSSTDTTVNITNVNLAPLATATVLPHAVYEGGTVTLDGTSSTDPDGDTLSYHWAQTAGIPVQLAADGPVATFEAPTVPFPQGTSLSFRLTVSDGFLSSHTDRIVNVLWINDPPKASLACPSTIDENEMVKLDGSQSSDPDDGISSYSWIQVQGLPNVDPFNDSSGADLWFTAPQLLSRENTPSFRLTVTDQSGLSDSAECTVTIKDVTPPAISPVDFLAVEAVSGEGATVTFAPSAYDAVDGTVSVSCSPPSGTLFPLQYTNVRCEAADAAGNRGTMQFPVKVQDTTSPQVTPPLDISVEATGPATAVEVIPASASDAVGVISLTHDAPGVYPVGVTTIKWVAQDAAGNIGSATSTVTVTDTTPPALSEKLSDLVVEATSAAGAVVSFSVPTATDLVDGPRPVTCSAPSGSTFPLGTTSVTCSASDIRSNTVSATFTVTVRDTTPPTLRLPGTVGPVEGNSLGGATTEFSVSAFDDVSGDLPVTCDKTSGTLFQLGETVVQCNAVDGAGNKAAGTFAIAVVDTRPPAFSNVPEAPTVIASAASGAAVFFSAPVAEDVVAGNVSVRCSAEPGAFFPIGTTEVTCTAADPADNAARVSFVVTVRYAFNGLFSPYDPGKNYKIGSTLPLKWQYVTSAGTAIPSVSASPVVSISKRDDRVSEEETVTLNDAAGGGLVYDHGSNTWHYNWKSSGFTPGTYYIQIRSELTKQVDGGFLVMLK